MIWPFTKSRKQEELDYYNKKMLLMELQKQEIELQLSMIRADLNKTLGLTCSNERRIEILEEDIQIIVGDLDQGNRHLNYLHDEFEGTVRDMDKLIKKVEKDVKGGKKAKAVKDIVTLKKADKVQDKKVAKCDMKSKMKGKK
jgi:hypothetical protein